MAIYHFSAQVISRASGRSAVAAAAYRAAARLEDERAERAHDFTAKVGVVHSEVLLPAGAPAAWADRATLWNAVEATEKRKDAQLAREIEFALPREMSQPEATALARDFVTRMFVARGMVADLNVHWDVGPDGSLKPHAHVMLTLRSVGPAGFASKDRAWNAVAELQGWREGWSAHVNARLAELGIAARIDHRTLEAQGLPLEPQHKIGPAGVRRAARGEAAERAAEHRQIAQRNGERLLAQPEIALTALTQQHSTFTRQDLARLVHRQTEGGEQFAAVMAKVEAAPAVVRLGADARGQERFTTRTMLAVEARMARAGEVLGTRREHAVHRAAQDAVLAKARLGDEQAAAFRHVTGGTDLALVVGYAGTGKSTMLGAAREAWEVSGARVLGAALSGIAAENLEGGSGINSRTIASYLHAWDRGRDGLSARDVLVVDEAGMVGSRQMERLLSVAQAAGAKVVLVGDPEQLQSIEAGAAFRALSDRHGAAEITTIRRQAVAWQRAATRELATARTGAALKRYAAAGLVQAHISREAAQAGLIAGWAAARTAAPGESTVILAATRAEVRDLNTRARAVLQAEGALGAERTVITERGARAFAAGDRLMFLRNERSLGVKNGTLGTVVEVAGAPGSEAATSLVVRLDGAVGRSVGFDLKDYAAVDLGYAATVHKAQGVTVDRVHVLASSMMDRHAAYVALTRHRAGVAVHWSREDLVDQAGLVRALSRERSKDTTLDYPDAPGERDGLLAQILARLRGERGIELERAIGTGVALDPGISSPAKGLAHTSAADVLAVTKPRLFAGLRLPSPGLGNTAEGSAATSADAKRNALFRAVEDYARAYTDAERMRAGGLPVLEHQRLALDRAGAALDAVQPGAPRDLRSALRHDAEAARVLREAHGPARAAGLVAGLEREQRAMADPRVRAERLAARWCALEAEHGSLRGSAHAAARAAVEARLRAVAQTLGRDGAAEAVLRQGGHTFGITADSALGRALAREGVPLAESLGRSLDRGLRMRGPEYGLSR